MTGCSRYAVLILFLLVLIPPSSAVLFFSGSDVVITEPSDDDVVASGGRVTVEAPVESLVAAGGEVVVRAPVRGDVILAGGTVTIDADVGGKVVAAGGMIDINSPVGRNVVCTGDTVTIGKNASVGRDAHISGRTVSNAGAVAGVLSVSAESLENSGTAGSVEFQRQEPDDSLIPGPVSIITAIGFLLLGLALIRFMPLQFGAVVGTLRERPIINTLVGIGLTLGGALACLVLAITIIGIPFAAIIGMLLILSFLISGLFVSAWIGGLIADRFSPSMNPYWRFVSGFVLFQIVLFIPVLGFLVQVLALFLGTGAAFETLWRSSETEIAG
ncbi:hypothetical protein [Methanofollis ethanolicus]|uniref:hypothetical protein n=1 Tax=Methanofollis ethanolicus TaxID=488124 RepID=UPI00082F1771|nr:hypothetical protein [Methanofollis ethanolicus]